MRKVVVVLEDEKLLELKRILIDEDEKAALKFLKENFEREIRKAETGHCKPIYAWYGAEPGLYTELKSKRRSQR